MTVGLHITNGDSAADLIRDAGIAGDVLPWRDPMHHGPWIASGDLDANCDVRANYLAGDMLDPDVVAADMRARDARLREALTRADEIVLWFEHDLLDQLQLIQILSVIAGVDFSSAITLICIGEHHDIRPFRGLGQLDASQIAALFPTRVPVTDAHLTRASAAWSAFCDPDPRCIEQIMNGEPHDSGLLPFLVPALRRHLEDYPWKRDGLTRTERQLLEGVRAGISRPGDLFAWNMEQETALFIGDWRTYSVIDALCGSPSPMLQTTSGEPFRYPRHVPSSDPAFREQHLALTEAGAEILGHGIGTGTGRESFRVRRHDAWLGGVHLSAPIPGWVYDCETASVVRRDLT